MKNKNANLIFSDFVAIQFIKFRIKSNSQLIGLDNDKKTGHFIFNIDLMNYRLNFIFFRIFTASLT